MSGRKTAARTGGTPRRKSEAGSKAGADPLQPFFQKRKWTPFPFQKETWEAYAEGKSGLLHAPTGLGKTLAVWLGPVREALLAAAGVEGAPAAAPPSGRTVSAPGSKSRAAAKVKAAKTVVPAVVEPKTAGPEGCRVLWITPLRALAADTLRALREPLEAAAPWLEVEARTGDTPASLRARLRKRLPFALVTTPESLSLMLTHADTREKLSGLRAVIVDEWHELLGTKRGVQTELCLARLRHWLPDLKTWGLSATLGNLEEAQDILLGTGGEKEGGEAESGKTAKRDGVIVSADLKKPIVIDTLIPEKMERFPLAGRMGTRLGAEVAEQIEKARTTLLFTNTRAQAELWFQTLLALRPDWEATLAMHHGSLGQADRERAETGLREGQMRCVVCTSSLDLGVDFSAVDQVIQVGSPKSVARLLQRAGRAGHQPGQTSRILGVPANALELVEFAAARDAAAAGVLESRRPMSRPLDVLVQHLVTCAIGAPLNPEQMLAEVRTAYSYRTLTDEAWEWCLGFISSGGRALAAYPRYQKARIENGLYTVDDSRLIQQHRMSIGTIQSDPAVTVKMANGAVLGTVEEGFMARFKPGSQFIFAGRRLELVRLHERQAKVRPAPKKSKVPVAVWGGTRSPLSMELSHALARRLAGKGEPVAEMRAVAPILELQRKWSHIPTDDFLLVELARVDEEDHLFVFPFAGRLVHEGLGAVVAWRLTQTIGESIQVTQNDYGFSLSAARGLQRLLDEETLREHLSPENLLADIVASMNTAELARRQFREIARVAGLILQPPPGRPSRSDREVQASASLLFDVLRRYDSGNLLLEQAEREILEKQLEFTRLREVMLELAGRPVVMVRTPNLTPMAFPLWADRLHHSTLHAGDAASRLEAMLSALDQAAG
ncbi:MAG: associated domain protein [Verrucomicrobiales bacterium]|nr:associated domain protein [Verrucomicrobiales bacterium]